jgi:hypothetical protein
MQGRHVRLLGVLVMLLLLSVAAGAYIFVIFHYAHLWSLIYVFAFMCSAFLSPAICWGFNASDEINMPENMSQERFLNCRDTGYALGLILYLQTYVIPAAAWWRSDGLAPSMGAVMVTYAGNLCCALAFELWARLFIWPGGAAA